MSKLDAQRAMRAAKYDAAQAASSNRPTKATAVGAQPAPRSTKATAKTRTKAPVVDVADEEAPELCGHRSMAGKACKRPAGHPETNHRYT